MITCSLCCTATDILFKRENIYDSVSTFSILSIGNEASLLVYTLIRLHVLSMHVSIFQIEMVQPILLLQDVLTASVLGVWSLIACTDYIWFVKKLAPNFLGGAPFPLCPFLLNSVLSVFCYLCPLQPIQAFSLVLGFFCGQLYKFCPLLQYFKSFRLEIVGFYFYVSFFVLIIS